MRDYVHRPLAHDHAIDRVTDGEAALAAVREAPPDLIVTHVMMPRLDGLGLLKGARSARTFAPRQCVPSTHPTG